MSPWDKLLEKPACGHLVQLYKAGDESPLAKNVGLYLSEGLNRGEGALAITTPEHRKLFIRELEQLGIDTAEAMRRKTLLWLDAQETLSRFIVSGWPDWNKFELIIGSAVRGLRPERHAGGFRAYGEMVDLLWQSRQMAAALRLENFWNKLLSRLSFSLYCAYAFDPSDPKSRASLLDDVLCAHTHVIPSEPCGDLLAPQPAAFA
jgi:hypothetical protein